VVVAGQPDELEGLADLAALVVLRDPDLAESVADVAPLAGDLGTRISP